MGEVFYSIHEVIAERMRSTFNLEVLVETGTETGVSALWAARRFKHVHTVEISPSRRDKARERIREQGMKNVTFYLGNSRDMLEHIVRNIKEPTLFWLDAHWHGSLEDAQDDRGLCPVLDEIDVINDIVRVRHVIMVDDARMFGFDTPRHSGAWPGKNQVISALHNNGQRSVATEDDVFVAIPHGEPL